MAGRPGKPLAFHLKGGNKSHLTKAEIKKREQEEVKIGTDRLVMPTYIRGNPSARAKWIEVIAIFKSSGMNLATSADVGIISRYCQAHSDYLYLLEIRDRLRDTDLDIGEAEEELEDMVPGERRRAIVVQKINFILSAAGLFQADTAVNKKLDQVLKLEDRLFLNMQSRVRNVPKKEAQAAVDEGAAAMFGGA
jgi:phage terminase small subunit